MGLFFYALKRGLYVTMSILKYGPALTVWYRF